MNFSKYFVISLLAIFVAACGGGGGAPGLPSGTIKPLTTTAPATLAMPIGSSFQYSIIGGKSPYVIESNDRQVAIGWVSGSNFSIGSLAAGSATLTLSDASGLKSSIAISVNTGPIVALFTTAPSPLNMSPTTTQTFVIGGGTTPYTVASDNVGVARALLGVDGVTLNVSALLNGVANLKVTDALGASTSVAVNVVSAGVALSVSPTTASTFVNMPVKVVVIGGTPPYRVAGIIPSAVSAVFDPIDTNQLFVTPLLVSSGLDVTILDSQNVSTKFTLTGIAGQPTTRLSPSALTVSENTFQSIFLTSFGSSSPLNVFSSDVTLFAVSVTADKITVTQRLKCVPADTDVTITVIDANKASASSVITVKDNGNRDATGTPPNFCP